jgi:hypothetical protein
MSRNVLTPDDNGVDGLSAWYDSPDVVFDAYLVVILVCLVVMGFIIAAAMVERYRRSRGDQS